MEKVLDMHEHGVLLLSFDDRNFDGWGKSLPLFEEYGAHATFFVCGPIDDQAVKVLKKLSAAGHTIGLHGLNHQDADKMIDKVGAERYFLDEIAPQIDCVRRACIPCSTFAYPNGVFSVVSDKLFKEKGFVRVRGEAKGAPPYDPEGRLQENREPLASYDSFFTHSDELPKRFRIDTIAVGEAYHTDIGEVLACLDRVAQRNEVISITSHNIASDARHIHMKTEWLELILKKAKELDLPVIGFDEIS